MIVDDHAAFRAVVRAVLLSAGWQCIECHDGDEAVERYAETKPDLVLMDISMQRMDGLRATALVKARFPAARIMMLTQHKDSNLQAESYKAGACGYILKEDLLDLPSLIAIQPPTAAVDPNDDTTLPPNQPTHV
jgi:DNA-binding NarL/FixJ family response regulator